MDIRRGAAGWHTADLEQIQGADSEDVYVTGEAVERARPAVQAVAARQYCHYLYVLHSAAATQDERGDIIPGASEWVAWGRCREETSGAGQEVEASDMHTYRSSSLVQLPVSARYIPDGTLCLVSSVPLSDAAISDAATREDLVKAGTIRIIGRSRKFDQGRLHCRLWL